MIFVTVGTHTQQFNRLLKVVDELVEKKMIKEKVIMQIGYSTYIPKNCDWFRFTDEKTIKKLYSKARLIITHGGAGSILNALINKKPIIAVPRLRKFKEHTNDHQVDLVKAMEKRGLVIGVYNIAKLYDAIRKVKKVKRKKRESKLAKELKEYLQRLSRSMVYC